MNSKTIVCQVEVNLYDKMIPIGSGYMQAYARTSNEVSNAYTFKFCTTHVSASRDDIVADVLATHCEIVTFSCYVWNMNLILGCVAKLRALSPNTVILLGGPEVMNQAEEILQNDWENVYICNGEGERIFKNFLLQLLESRPDLSTVNGLSLVRDNTIITNDEEPRLKDINEIPSPYLSGLFDGKLYARAVFETNRGCPFKCSYCYWGAATNDIVTRFDPQRVRDEIHWLSNSYVPMVFIADANWGMTKIDIEYSELFASLKKKNGAPLWIYYSSAKNSPKRVAEISSTLRQADMVNMQPISIQSMDAHTLKMVDRSNIKLESYHELQSELNDSDVDSFIEMIFPLPGETLFSFKKGISRLCELDAARIGVYPHTLLKNTPIFARKEELGLKTRTVVSDISSTEYVVQTNEVSEDDFNAAFEFYFGFKFLYNFGVLKNTMKYLFENDLCSFENVISSFTEFMHQSEFKEYTAFTQSLISNLDIEMNGVSSFSMETLYFNRKKMLQQVLEFARSQSWYNDQTAMLVEMDIAMAPVLFTDTKNELKNIGFQHLSIDDVDDGFSRLRCSSESAELLSDITGLRINSDIKVNYINDQRKYSAFSSMKNQDEKNMYIQSLIYSNKRLTPTVEQTSS